MLLGSKWINTNRVFTTDYGGDMHSDTPTKIMDQIIAKYSSLTINHSSIIVLYSYLWSFI